jgi:peptidoglycan/xylan/chitin deacetylase (PgdA/CDA1 family)
VKPYLVKTPLAIQKLFPRRVWSHPNVCGNVFLSFDDGPIPEVTPWVLDELKKYDAQATFFCIGENVTKHPEIFKRIISEGHSIGNHTFHHINGWKSSASEYIDDVNLAESSMRKIFNAPASSQKLFRPPFGKLRSKQANLLQRKGYKIIMWDIISADFDTRISKEQCLQNVIKRMQPGSIVVFHDSLKVEKNLRYTLPRLLEFIHENNWNSRAIKLKN